MAVAEGSNDSSSIVGDAVGCSCLFGSRVVGCGVGSADGVSGGRAAGREVLGAAAVGDVVGVSADEGLFVGSSVGVAAGECDAVGSSMQGDMIGRRE